MLSEIQLIDLPPEVIDNIYKLLNIKDKIKFSLANSYIYDCRPADEINNYRWNFNHKKNMKTVFDHINSIRYGVINIYPAHPSRINFNDSYRIFNNVGIQYRYTSQNNILRSVKSHYFNYLDAFYYIDFNEDENRQVTTATREVNNKIYSFVC